MKTFSWLLGFVMIGCAGTPEPTTGNGGASNAGGAGTIGGSSSSGGSANCNCLNGAYNPVCGVNGTTYDAHCGDVCVPVAIACQGACPCTVGSTGGSSSQGGSSAVGTGGGAALGSTFDCHGSTCTVGQSYCYSFIGGIPGSTTSYNCRNLPASCADATDCTCLCANTYPGCSPSQGCSCGASDGQINMSCAGS
jgi:hypothetical protein